MTPQQKAEELVAKYQRILPLNLITMLDAKNCALIAVDEIKLSLFNNNLMNVYDYWFEVKQEIEKL